MRFDSQQGREGIFCLCHRVQTSSMVHLASYPMGISVLLEQSGWGTKLTTHIHVNAKVKNVWIYISTPPLHLYGMVLN